MGKRVGYLDRICIRRKSLSLHMRPFFFFSFSSRLCLSIREGADFSALF